jgi:hypothetical protein
LAKDWNAKWRWPEFRTIADLSNPFKEIERGRGAVRSRVPRLPNRSARFPDVGNSADGVCGASVV